MRNIFYACTIAAACLATTPVLAADAKLVWKDLDLTTEAGKTELSHRIDVAAQQACEAEVVTGSRIARKPSSTCLNEARNQITVQIAAKTQHMAKAEASAMTAAR